MWLYSTFWNSILGTSYSFGGPGEGPLKVFARANLKIASTEAPNFASVENLRTRAAAMLQVVCGNLPRISEAEAGISSILLLLRCLQKRPKAPCLLLLPNSRQVKLSAHDCIFETATQQANFCVFCSTGPPGDRGALHCHLKAIATQPIGLVPLQARGILPVA